MKVPNVRGNIPAAKNLAASITENIAEIAARLGIGYSAFLNPISFPEIENRCVALPPALDEVRRMAAPELDVLTHSFFFEEEWRQIGFKLAVAPDD
jgi:hypothetical protein